MPKCQQPSVNHDRWEVDVLPVELLAALILPMR